MAEHYSVDSLRRIMELLRAPGGCPWDRAQTHQSIRANMLEEAYEAVDAIDHMDMDNLKEELGDVLLQVVFHACMAQEAGRFTFDDVVDGICKKLVYRHPHVFGAAEAGDAEGALSAWDAGGAETKLSLKSERAAAPIALSLAGEQKEVSAASGDYALDAFSYGALADDAAWAGAEPCQRLAIAFGMDISPRLKVKVGHEGVVPIAHVKVTVIAKG